MWGCLQWLDAGPTKAAKAAGSGAKAPCPVPGSAVPRPKIAARGAPRGDAPCSGIRKPPACARPLQTSLHGVASVMRRDCIPRLSALRPLAFYFAGRERKDRHTRRLTKHGPAERWLAPSSSPDLISQVGSTRLAQADSAELGQARVPIDLSSSQRGWMCGSSPRMTKEGMLGCLKFE